MRWYVVRTQRARETTAQSHLRFQGYETFLPVHWKTVRHARQFRTSKAPLFPNYLFVAIDLHRDRWRAVNSTVGVASLIMAGERPAAVPDGLVESLAARHDERDMAGLGPQLAPGDPVRVVSGPFAGLIGHLHTIDEAGRVKILLDLLGGQTLVWTQAGLLSPAA